MIVVVVVDGIGHLIFGVKLITFFEVIKKMLYLLFGCGENIRDGCYFEVQIILVEVRYLIVGMR